LRHSGCVRLAKRPLQSIKIVPQLLSPDEVQVPSNMSLGIILLGQFLKLSNRTWLFRAIHIFQVSRYGWCTGIREGAWQITSNLRSPLFALTPVLTSRAALWPSSRPTLRQNIF